MKRFSQITLLILLLAGLLLAGCSGEVGTKLEGDDRDAVLEYVDPITDNLLAGMVANDYATFSKDFNEEMLGAIDQTKFEALVRQLNDQIGAYQSRTVDSVTDYGKMVTAQYKGVYAKSDKVNIVVTVTKEEPHQITGLYFR